MACRATGVATLDMAPERRGACSAMMARPAARLDRGERVRSRVGRPKGAQHLGQAQARGHGTDSVGQRVERIER